VESVRSGVSRRLSLRPVGVVKGASSARTTTAVDVLAGLIVFNDWTSDTPEVPLMAAVREVLRLDPRRAERSSVGGWSFQLQQVSQIVSLAPCPFPIVDTRKGAAVAPLPRHYSAQVDSSPFAVMVRVQRGEIRLHVRTVPFVAFECVPHPSHVILSVTGHVDEMGDTHQRKWRAFEWLPSINELSGPLYQREVLLPCLCDPASQSVEHSADGTLVTITLAVVKVLRACGGFAALTHACSKGGA
jgi:hypothetical protein